MLAESFLTTITISRKEPTLDGTTKRQKTGTTSTVVEDVPATLSHDTVARYDSIMGTLSHNKTLLFVPAGTDIKQGDTITDDLDDKVYVVTTNPFTFLNPINKTADHMEMEVVPEEPHQ